MALLRFFRPPKHQRYEYRPRYYDPAKEDLKERLRLADRKKSNDAESTKARIAAGFGRRSGSGSYLVSAEARRQSTYRSNMRLVIVFVVLVVGTILVLLEFLPNLLEMLE